MRGGAIALPDRARGSASSRPGERADRRPAALELEARAEDGLGAGLAYDEAAHRVLRDLCVGRHDWQVEQSRLRHE